MECKWPVTRVTEMLNRIYNVSDKNTILMAYLDARVQDLGSTGILLLVRDFEVDDSSKVKTAVTRQGAALQKLLPL